MHPRFSWTKSLKIEYGLKRGDPPPHDVPLYDLLKHGGDIAWSHIGVNTVPEALAMQSCGLEAVYMGSILSELNEAGAAKVFPELETVAVASIYGPNSDLRYR
jgi:hypothetical protein